MGDLDGDGDLDVFYLNRFNRPNKVYFNDGVGTFTDSGQSLGSRDSADVALGDLDGDGDLDALVTNPDTGSGGGPTEVWTNNGAGFFSLHQALGTYLSTGVDLGDLDGDGDLDAVFSAGGHIAARPKAVLHNDGSGTFTEAQLLGSAFGADVALGDLDSDGDLDIYATNISFADEVWFNTGDGTFTDSGQGMDIELCDSGFPDLGDLDGDGDLDVFIPCGGLVSGQPNKVWFNETWFQAEPMPEAFGGPGFAQCADDPDSFYLVGGAGPALYEWRDEFYKYDATSNTWTDLAPLPQGLLGVAATCYEGKIYAAGGWRSYAVNDFYIYDLATNTWSGGPDLPRFVSGAALAAWDGKLYLAGGSPGAVPAPPVTDVDIYDIASGTWYPAAGPGMPEPAGLFWLGAARSLSLHGRGHVGQLQQ